MEAKIRSKSRKMDSKTLPDSGSDFGRLFGSARGGPMCSKYSKYHIQLTFRTSPKSTFLAPFSPPFWSLLGTFFAIFGCPGPLQNKVQKTLSQKVAPGPKMSENGLQNGSLKLQESPPPLRDFCGHVCCMGPRMPK